MVGVVADDIAIDAMVGRMVDADPDGIVAEGILATDAMTLGAVLQRESDGVLDDGIPRYAAVGGGGSAEPQPGPIANQVIP